MHFHIKVRVVARATTGTTQHSQPTTRWTSTSTFSISPSDRPRLKPLRRTAHFLVKIPTHTRNRRLHPSFIGIVFSQARIFTITITHYSCCFCLAALSAFLLPTIEERLEHDVRKDVDVPPHRARVLMQKLLRLARLPISGVIPSCEVSAVGECVEVSAREEVIFGICRAAQSPFGARNRRATLKNVPLSFLFVFDDGRHHIRISQFTQLCRCGSHRTCWNVFGTDVGAGIWESS